ncbi:MAG: hypothetical protein PHQ59_03500 [Candidatus Daviesbacteria bacterium]|nr:hypothetical protein [Candidatus Daviesbacteria bacterium]
MHSYTEFEGQIVIDENGAPENNKKPRLFKVIENCGSPYSKTVYTKELNPFVGLDGETRFKLTPISGPSIVEAVFKRAQEIYYHPHLSMLWDIFPKL